MQCGAAVTFHSFPVTTKPTEFKSLKKLRGVRVFVHLCRVALTHPRQLTVRIARPEETGV